jgi:hypothetical protein
MRPILSLQREKHIRETLRDIDKTNVREINDENEETDVQ